MSRSSVTAKAKPLGPWKGFVNRQRPRYKYPSSFEHIVTRAGWWNWEDLLFLAGTGGSREGEKGSLVPRTAPAWGLTAR